MTAFATTWKLRLYSKPPPTSTRPPKRRLVLWKVFRAITTTLLHGSVLPGIQPATARPSSASDMDCFTTILSLQLPLTPSRQTVDAPCSFFPQEVLLQRADWLRQIVFLLIP